MIRHLVVLLSAAVVLCAATTSYAQSPRVGLYSDATASGCSGPDSSPGFFQVFVVIQNIEEVTGVIFRVVPSQDFTAVLVGELCPLPPFPFVDGDALSGLAMAFGNCYTSPVKVYTLTFQRFGTSGTCAHLALAPHPSPHYETITLIDCHPNNPASVVIPQSSTDMFILNPNGSCGSCGFPVPVEHTTWGAVKALYH